jgi:acyl carrier protein
MGMGEAQEKLDLGKLKDEIKKIVSRISRIDVNELDDQVLIREELGIDSLMSMEILATCEKYLGIKIDESLFADVQTVDDFLNLLLKLKKQSSG